MPPSLAQYIVKEVAKGVPMESIPILPLFYQVRNAYVKCMTAVIRSIPGGLKQPIE